mmetsp:Transcript_36746/g.108353  ORF Transcript_36746/g.108353 Transcript_36746/m.108353 type:complete len:92 (+) Transcript_36746:1161-1436(+)
MQSVEDVCVTQQADGLLADDSSDWPLHLAPLNQALFSTGSAAATPSCDAVLRQMVATVPSTEPGRTPLDLQLRLKLQQGRKPGSAAVAVDR